jgi:RimJ/RimL family protein N-acetyltransferase
LAILEAVGNKNKEPMLNLPHTLRTERLILRRWRQDDLPLFAAMNMDAKVMEHFPAILLPAESDQFAARIQVHFDKHGFGLWAVEIPGVFPFIGYIGMLEVGFDAEFTPAVEIGWRLAHAYWGKGYALEGAKRVLQLAFEEAKLPELVSFTVPANKRSRNVMERIGMEYVYDFDHPKLPEGHPLKQHVLYRITRNGYYDIMNSAVHV